MDMNGYDRDNPAEGKGDIPAEGKDDIVFWGWPCNKGLVNIGC
jgi:hypothetical protein